MAIADDRPGAKVDDNGGALDTTTDANESTLDDAWADWACDEANRLAEDSTEGADDESVDASSARTWARTRRKS